MDEGGQLHVPATIFSEKELPLTIGHEAGRAVIQTGKREERNLLPQPGIKP
jgi:hypothetical protein